MEPSASRFPFPPPLRETGKRKREIGARAAWRKIAKSHKASRCRKARTNRLTTPQADETPRQARRARDGHTQAFGPVKRRRATAGEQTAKG
jgi:hypothetical protein